VAHAIWQNFLSPYDTVIDATCGNGKDTCALAKCVPQGKVLSFDIQEKALENTKKLLLAYQLEKRVELFLISHDAFPSSLLPGSIRLVVYNLGYLPGGNKKLTTLASSTMRSITLAQHLLAAEGLISIMLYPGHPEGAVEKKLLLDTVNKLSTALWEVCHLEWSNRANSPSLLLLRKLGSLESPPPPCNTK
jgi:hypothetical protein